jgi:hypothetical protein
MHEVPANNGIPTQAPQLVHRWACETCRNVFRLVEAAGDQRDTLFDV